MAETTTEHDETIASRLWQIASRPQAIVKATTLPRVWGLDDAAAKVLLDKLVDIKLVDTWDKGRYLCLSDRAIQWLDLEAIPDRRGRLVLHDRKSYRAERARQEADMFTGRHVQPKTKGLAKVILESDLQDDEGAVSLDEILGPMSCDQIEAGQPTMLLGLGYAWSNKPGSGPCKGCGHYRGRGRHQFPASAYCCDCNKSGNRRLRAVLPEGVTADKTPKPAAKPSPALAGGTGTGSKGKKKAKNKSMIGAR